MKKILLYGNGFDIELGKRLGLDEKTELRHIIKQKIFAIPSDVKARLKIDIDKFPEEEFFFENYFRIGEQFEKEVELFINNFEFYNNIKKTDIEKKRNIIKESIITFKDERKSAYIKRCKDILEPIYRNFDLLLNKKVYKDHKEELLVNLSVEQRIGYAKMKLADENMKEQINLIQNATNIMYLYNNYCTLLTTNYFLVDEIIIIILRKIVTIKHFIEGTLNNEHRLFSAFNNRNYYGHEEVNKEFNKIISFLEIYEDEFLVFKKMKHLFIEWGMYKGSKDIKKSYKINSFDSMMGNIDYMDYIYSSNTKDSIFNNVDSTQFNTLEEEWIKNIKNISEELSKENGSADITIFGFSPINDIFLMKVFSELMDNNSKVTFIMYEGDSNREWYKQQMNFVKDIFKDRFESFIGKIEDLARK